MTKTTKTTTTQNNNTTTQNNNTKATLKSRYIPKLVVNGQVVAQHAKQIITTIKGTEVQLNCTYISDLELKTAYFSSFNIKANDKDIEVIYAKIGTRVSATIYINKVLVFSSLSMQAVFTVISTAYGISKNYLNSMYIKSNSTRKQSSKSVSKVVVNNTFDF